MDQVRYGRILKEKEKDNPDSFCRASYLVSNTAEMVKIWGRVLRFPHLKAAFFFEMKLAMGDVIMQCRLIEVEGGKESHEIDNYDDYESKFVGTFEIEETLMDMNKDAANVGRMLFNEIEEYSDCILRLSTLVELLLENCGKLCVLLGWDFDQISHLGFLHVMERFEQFEKEGW
jgi:hypothetical protein